MGDNYEILKNPWKLAKNYEISRTSWKWAYKKNMLKSRNFAKFCKFCKICKILQIKNEICKIKKNFAKKYTKILKFGVYQNKDPRLGGAKR